MKPRSLAMAALLCAVAFGSVALSQSTPDRPVTATNKVLPLYPAAAKAVGLESGYAKALFWVDEIGRASDFLVVAHNGKVFGDALVAALKQWDFDPKIQNGGPVGSVHAVECRFRSTELLVVNVRLPDSAGESRGDRMGEVLNLPVDTDELDSPLALAEVYPLYLDSRKRDRFYLDVEFFVDENGLVLLPSLLDPDAGEAEREALEVFRTWRFEPPRKDGKPALASVTRRIAIPIQER